MNADPGNELRVRNIREIQRNVINPAERRRPDIGYGEMDAIYLERMKHRLANMRKVAALAHDPRIIELVTQTAEELEADIRKLEAEASTPLSIESRLED